MQMRWRISWGVTIFLTNAIRLFENASGVFVKSAYVNFPWVMNNLLGIESTALFEQYLDNKYVHIRTFIVKTTEIRRLIVWSKHLGRKGFLRNISDCFSLKMPSVRSKNGARGPTTAGMNPISTFFFFLLSYHIFLPLYHHHIIFPAWFGYNKGHTMNIFYADIEEICVHHLERLNYEKSELVL